MVVLGLGDVPSLRALWTVDDLELDRLTLFQGSEAVATDRGVVHEHVAATLALNEPIAFGVVEPLDLACDAHRSLPCLQCPLTDQASRAGSRAIEATASVASCFGGVTPEPWRKAQQMSFEAQKKDRE